MIEVTHLTKRYGRFVAVDDVSFSIHQGEIVGLLGPNGAGKTTTIRILTGYLNLNSGGVNVAGYDIMQDSLEIRKKIGYLSESAPLYDEMNVSEFLEFSAEMHDVPHHEIAEKIHNIAGLCGLKDRLRQEIRELSKGYRQRVGLASALIHSPEILILDEPTTGLDPNQRVEIRDLIKRIGREKTVILSSHILSEVEATCDRVFIIHKGKIVAQGTPAELKSGNKSQKKLYLSIEGSLNAILDKLRGFSGISRIIDANEKNGINEFILEVDPSVDVRKPLVRFLFENQFELLEIYQDEQSLEDVFMQLTKG
jgi:ABC-2 type transport system ATP-binding protein